METPIPFDAQQINRGDMFNQTQTRRKFLKNLALGIGVAATADVLAGCSTPAAAKEQDRLWIPDNVRTHMDVAKDITSNNPHPRLWRTTASLWCYDANGGGYEGTGSLVKHGKGYGILSVKHVTDDMSELPYAYFFLPELPITKVDPVRFKPMVTGAEDSPVFYSFNPSENAAVEKQVRAGLVTPLELGQKKLHPGVRLYSANPRLGIFEDYKLEGFVHDGTADLAIVGDLSCHGESGTALLSEAPIDREPSNKVYAVIDRVNRQLPKNNENCTTSIVASSIQ